MCQNDGYGYQDSYAGLFVFLSFFLFIAALRFRVSKRLTRSGKAMSTDMLVKGSPHVMGIEVGTRTLVVILAWYTFGGFSCVLFRAYVVRGGTDRRNMILSICSSNSVDFFQPEHSL